MKNNTTHAIVRNKVATRFITRLTKLKFEKKIDKLKGLIQIKAIRSPRFFESDGKKLELLRYEFVRCEKPGPLDFVLIVKTHLNLPKDLKPRSTKLFSTP